MERIVKQKTYQINQRSLALTGKSAIDDFASRYQAKATTKGAPSKFIVNTVTPLREVAPSKEFKKTQCNITRFAKVQKDTRVQGTVNNISILRPNIR